jgi:hypothetical protein
VGLRASNRSEHDGEPAGRASVDSPRQGARFALPFARASGRYDRIRQGGSQTRRQRGKARRTIRLPLHSHVCSCIHTLVIPFRLRAQLSVRIGEGPPAVCSRSHEKHCTTTVVDSVDLEARFLRRDWFARANGRDVPPGTIAKNRRLNGGPMILSTPRVNNRRQPEKTLPFAHRRCLRHKEPQ